MMKLIQQDSKLKFGTQENGFSHVKFLHDYDIFMFISLFKESKYVGQY